MPAQCVMSKSLTVWRMAGAVQKLFVQQLKNILRYVLVLAITGLLVYFSLSSMELAEGASRSEFLLNVWRQSDKSWLMVMTITAMVSHALRAIRWQMLLEPTGNRSSFRDSFLSLMTGYMVNLVVPRGGEITRSLNLYKITGIPVPVSFGTVITERVVDVIFLASLVGLSFWIEWDKLDSFLSGLPFSSDLFSGRNLFLILIGGTILFFFGWLFWRWLRKNPKLKGLAEGFAQGIASIFKLTSPSGFIGISFLIWGLYFFMTYTVIRAFDHTAALGVEAVLTVFAIGSVAMAAPLPGGTGSYHTLVPLGLVALYSVPKTEAVALVFIFHALQTLIMLVAGLISLFISMALYKKTG